MSYIITDTSNDEEYFKIINAARLQMYIRKLLHPKENKQVKYLKHIPTQCCYEILDEDGTIEICGARMQPKVDGEIFWEYTNEYVEKVVAPSNPFKRG